METYGDFRDDIKSGDLLAWSYEKFKGMNDIIPFTVRLFTQSEFYHVGIAWVVGGRVFVIDAMPPKVRIYPLSKKVPFYHMPMNMEWQDKNEEFLLTKVGEDYSYFQAMRAIFGAPSEDNMWQCAELANRFYRYSGIELGDGYTPSDVVREAMKITGQGLKYISP